jgi:phospholipase/lecithinase/hemolysin
VQWIDIDADFAEFRANPAVYGFVNVTTPACDRAKMATITGGLVTDGTSLFCNATPNAPYNGLAVGADVNTWLFADGNHPTTGGHKAFSDAILKQLRGAGWL